MKPGKRSQQKTCGISNALDGTEDDKLYTEEGQEINDDEDNKFETESKGDKVPTLFQQQISRTFPGFGLTFQGI